ncbi:MAG: TetR/AcrR family transcriptional regulator [Anaerolineae bacterium]|nr:TetR/AcrR family transcriptional regulator [Anaerolineae bacterium]
MHGDPMNKAISKLESNRQKGKHQVDDQRANILDAAEKLFLQQGLENTKMVDIAAQAGITKVTLYRYFPNRDVIALEIHVRMMNKIVALVDSGDQDISLKGTKKLACSMIRNFDELRDAYRYMGMFDSLYLDLTPGMALPQWTKSQLIAFTWSGVTLDEAMREDPQGNRLIMIMSTVIWFLEKLALRGELTWSDQAIPLEEHLKSFEEMIMGYIDQLLRIQDLKEVRST